MATYKASLISLKSCLINLPQSLTRSLMSNNVPAQNVVAVLSLGSKKAYAGWTGHSAGDGKSIEMDPAYARNIGVSEGSELSLELKISPRDAEVVWVEPLSADDWEIMELHASFLELNLLNQIRAVSTNHPVTIYLSAHTTATIIVKKIEPELQSGEEFAKLSTSAEVIVSPKTRQTTQGGTTRSKSVASAKSRGASDKAKSPNVFFRAVPELSTQHPGLHVYVPSSIWRSTMAMPKYVEIQVILPPSLRRISNNSDAIAPPLPSKDGASTKEIRPATKIVARAHAVEDLSGNVAKLSPSVINALGIELGSRVKLCPATSPKKISSLTCHCKLGQSKRKEIKIGKGKDEEVIDAFRSQLSALGGGPATHGLQLDDFVLAIKEDGDWGTLPTIDKLNITQGEDVIVTQVSVPKLDQSRPKGIEMVAGKVRKICSRYGGVLLYGSRGSGKSAIANACARAAEGAYNHVVVADCSKLSEERVPTIKESLNRWFSEAAWYEPSVVMIDDLDRLCPAEVEHADSTRARQIAEIFLSAIRQFTTRHAIAVLATSQSKEALHAILTTSHIFDETISLKPPNKTARREIIQSLLDSESSDAVDWLEVANMTDGYLAGDLKFLTERAKHECLMREMTESPDAEFSTLQTSDYEKAIKGFTPASLRGIKLQKSSVEWKDIGGLEETRRILLETLEWPTRYAPIFANCPLRLRSGLLLYGYPGCGKTLLASAVASECGLNFIAVKGPEILNKYIGASEKSVRDLFDRAQAAKPCVLFFDEFDSIAPKRGHDSTGVTDRVVNQMLTQMDGAEGLEGVYVLAATSRPDLIDPALLRPGRLDKSLLCSMPDQSDRRSILVAQSRKMHLSTDVDLDHLASRTEGFSGADLQAVLYNAHLEAIHDVISKREEEEMSASGQLETGSSPGVGHGPVTFTRFQLGEGGGSSKSPASDHHGTDAAASVKTSAELAAISARVEAILTNAEQRKGGRGTGQGSSHHDGGGDTSASGTGEQRQIIRITPANLAKSLSSTKPSISAEERRRLDGVYHDFVDGRSADGLPDGRAPAGKQRATLA